MTEDDASTAVRVLLDAARITMSDEEFARLVAGYPTIRAQTDALYREELRNESPAVSYDPLVDFS